MLCINIIRNYCQVNYTIYSGIASLRQAFFLRNSFADLVSDGFVNDVAATFFVEVTLKVLVIDVIKVLAISNNMT